MQSKLITRGQIWRNRGGDMVTIVAITGNDYTPVIYQGESGISCAVDLGGRWSTAAPSPYDLVEMVEDVR